MNKDQREIQRKLRILQHAEATGHVAKTCRYFGVGRSSFYRWRQAYAEQGEAGLVNAPPIPKWHANRTPPNERKRSFIYVANTISAPYGLFGIWSVTMASRYLTRPFHVSCAAMGSIAFLVALECAKFIPSAIKSRFQGIIFRWMLSS